MDFARKQLEKYGWTDGQGLGKDGTGISAPIKPKLKFDNSGLGHSISDDLLNPWWQKVYDDAANNVIVKKENKKVSLETKGNSVDITTKKKSKYKDSDLSEYGRFVKVSSLTKVGEKRIRKELSSESEEENDKNKRTSGVINLTDEELFKICGGRTVHKGARHGLKMSAKLSRIQQHEEQFICHDILEGNTMDNKQEVASDATTTRNKKKKKKRDLDCGGGLGDETLHDTVKTLVSDGSKVKKKKKRDHQLHTLDMCEDHTASLTNGECAVKEKKKNKKHKREKCD